MDDKMKFRVTKVQIDAGSNLWKSPASAVLTKALSALNPSWYKCLKFGENIQKIYESVRKQLQDECHCA